MPVFLALLKKIAPYLKYVAFAAAIIVLLLMWRAKSKQADQLSQALDLYKRQMAGQLTDQEKKFQEANDALGVSQSKLMEQDQLVKAYQAENISVNAAFEKYKKEYNIELESFERTIAQLQEQLKSKNTTTVSSGTERTPTDPLPDSKFNHVIDPQKEKISYDWKSGDGRFELYDPDIFVASEEKTFKLNQNFRVTGEIYREKVGFLKTQRLTIEEVIPDGKNADGSVKYKVVGNAKIVESKFAYTELSPDTWVPKRGVFGLWGVVSANFGLSNGLNPRFLLGTGLEFLQWKGLGLGVQAYLDTKVWQDSAFGVSIAYRPTIKTTQLNIAVDVGLATQFRQAFQSYVPTVGLIFHMW